MRVTSAIDLAIRALSELAAALPVAASSKIRKDPQLWVFGAWLGKRYADNPRYLFEYVTEHEPSVRAVWLTHRSRIRGELTSLGLESEVWWSPRGMRTAARAQVWFFTHEPSDLSPVAGRGARMVNLTHGTPLKRIGRATRPGRLPPGAVWMAAASASVRPKTDFVACASPAAAERFRLAEGEGFPPDSVVPTGYPRWRPFTEAPPVPDELRDLLVGAELTILYAPTQRAFGEGSLGYADLAGFADFLAWLDRAGAVTLYRDHLASRSPQHVGHPAWIPVPQSVCPDINDLLPHIDVLITDYSSIFYDYSLFRDRAIFLAPDKAAYEASDQGFFVHYEAEVPGPVVCDWHGVLEALEDGPVPDEGRLAAFRTAHGAFADGASCERLVQLINSHVARPAAERGDQSTTRLRIPSNE